jgi:ribosomal-protein-alanine N-acetyltransferase
MTIRNYICFDKEDCLEVFDSNCPKYFDKSERDMFIKWLDHQGDQEIQYKSPTYSNSEKDSYSVIENEKGKVVACGGFYVVKDLKEARLAWGMVHNDLHQKGFGKALYLHRKNQIEKEFPEHIMTLGTSQHTFPFYEKMGMKVIASFKNGYGEGLDRYDMEL